LKHKIEKERREEKESGELVRGTTFEGARNYTREGLVNLWLYKESNKLRD
jgi:hypothetical protein